MSTGVPAIARTGVAGAGVFGGFHARKLHESALSRFVGVFDPDPARAEALAGQFDAQAYADYPEFLAALDAVIIAAPAAAHGPLALAALELGRHVYVEKPIALDPEEAARMIALARRNACALQVGHQERFVLAAFGLPRADKRPHLLEFVRRGPSSGRCEEVSVAIDLMIHDLDLMSAFGFEAPRDVKAAGGPHEIAATLTFPDGASCRFLASRRSAQRSRKLIAHYDDGRIELDFIERTLTNSTKATLAGAASLASIDPLKASVEAFLHSILTKSTVAIPGEAGAAALRLALAIEESIRNLSRVLSSVDAEAARSARVGT